MSLVGTWVTRVATSWLVYRLTGSALLLGITGFAGQIPLLLLAPFGGVLVDRWNRHRMLVVTQILTSVPRTCFFASSRSICGIGSSSPPMRSPHLTCAFIDAAVTL